MVDYIIVGLGLAGISFCEQLEGHNKTFKVINDNSQTSSKVAGGLYNPVILKRFTLAWQADEQLKEAKSFYADLEAKLKVRLDYGLPVYRRFHSAEEQNQWFEASDKKGLGKFLSTDLIPNTNAGIDAPFGFGEVKHTGRIDTEALLSSYKKYLLEKALLLEETFDFDNLRHTEEGVAYGTLRAKRIVFAEGYGLKSNPFFNYLPLQGSKGEYLMVKAPDLKEDKAIKSAIFIIPQGGDVYRVGANYERNDKTNTPTEAAKNGLLDKLRAVLKCDFELIDQVAGIRPTVEDRKPLVGRHPKMEHMYVLNGFGSRGVLIGPSASKQLYGFVENREALDPQLDIARFTQKYFR
ncbi:NAD(P)/FAD-dependent oxidoreductase [Zobellia galactanivorans]|uniref:FAD dependent oxidoreductase n=1 Tax=Zobellia galactanivorans (strain DSM 12802 / CCUG 47099 / CIP 106680 / NCIMB 13871 / Dsij) TaxID=63186 RepID=G0LAB4_ZOBGA|nr:FAD-binding oxidoreductase [Zobellia galactanivorans]CAZ95204.1 FAD dependent oxidoreductase [Zobellia galactanivorans]